MTEWLAEATGSWRKRTLVALLLLFAAFGTVFALHSPSARIEDEPAGTQEAPK